MGNLSEIKNFVSCCNSIILILRLDNCKFTSKLLNIHTTCILDNGGVKFPHSCNAVIVLLVLYLASL